MKLLQICNTRLHVNYHPSPLERIVLLPSRFNPDLVSPHMSRIKASLTAPTWRQGLLELLGLLLVCDDQGVQVPAAAHLELYIVLVLLDLYGCRTTRTRLDWGSHLNVTLVHKCPLPRANNGLCVQERMRLLHLASFLLAVSRKSLISSILRGCEETQT